MDSKLNNEIVVELIISDLLLGKMMLGLHKLHIDASTYSLNLSQVVFRLMGIEEYQQTEELYDLYTVHCLKALDTNFEVNDTKSIQLLATGIHTALKQKTYIPKQDEKALK